MALTPVEIRHIRLRKAFFGYQMRQTDELLAQVVTSFEDVWRDRADLADKIEQLEGELVRYRELEQLLRTTLISAERASQQMTDQARRETESVLNDARAEAREIVRSAMADREQLRAEVNRMRAQLTATLASIGGDVAEPARTQMQVTQAPASPQTLTQPPPVAAPPRPPESARPAAPQSQPGMPAAPAPAPARPAQPAPQPPLQQPQPTAPGQSSTEAPTGTFSIPVNLRNIEPEQH
jgi:cell division initiation protein